MRIETIDDKYLYDNIFRFETDEDTINLMTKKHKKKSLISFFINIALTFLFFSMALVSADESQSFFLVDFFPENIHFIFNIFYVFFGVAVYQFVLFAISYSTFYRNVICKKFSNKFFTAFKKINSDDFSQNLEFDNENKFMAQKTFSVKTTSSFNLNYSVLIDEDYSDFVIKVGNNFYSKIFSLRNIVNIFLYCNGVKYNMATSEYSVKELLLQGYIEEGDFLKTCTELKIVIVMVQPVKEFPIIFVDKKRFGRKQAGIIDSVDEITSYLLSKSK